MRSRFVTTNYFETLSENSSFLTLPIPHFPPPRHDHSSAFDSLFPLDRPELIVPLSNSALVSFLDAVIPRRLQVSELTDELTVAGLDDKEVDSGETLVSEAVRVNRDEKASDGLLFVQYETPEPNVFLDKTDSFGNDGMLILSDLTEIEKNVGSCGSLIEIQYSDEVVESIYSINNIPVEYPVKQTSSLFNYGGHNEDQKHNPKCEYPLFEVNEMTDEGLTSLLMENNLLSLFETTEIPHRMNLTINCDELLGSMDSNVLELLSDHLQPKNFLESQPEYPNKISTDMEFMGILDTSYLQKHSSYHHEAAAADHILSVNSLMFQEFQILDANAYFEAFENIRSVDEPKTCDQIFGKGMNVEQFNELIVCHELALVDNTFTSLPVPILSDFEKLRSPNVIQSVFSTLKLMPLSASYEIYLDWRLLEGVAFVSEVSPCNQDLLKEIGLQNLDFNFIISDDEKVLDDLFFSDDDPKKPCKEKLENLFNMPSGDISIPSGLAKVEMTTIESGQCSSLGTEEKLHSEGAKRASYFFQSISQSNDLEFFLKRQRAAVGETVKPTKNEFESNLAHQRVPFSVPDATSTISSSKSQQCNIPYSSAVKALCEGVDMARNIELSRDEEFCPIQGHTQDMVNEKEEQLNFIPLQEKINMELSYAEDGTKVHRRPLPVSGDSLAGQSEQIQESLESLPTITIIANTKSNDEEMIVSRRSTYQKILAMEREGVQVVERDSDLPVDIIVSASICLVWYNIGNIGKKASDSDVNSSSLPLCIQYIATNVLTLLSYCFSSCILVFEGDIRFLGSVMDSADGLYASAASLGIKIQLFCSYSSELTDEIILSCIKHTARLTSSLLSKMTESENLAESFLTKIPSINPLTGHVISSSGGTLAEFLGLSLEQKIDAIEKYHVHSGSVALFSILCKYGEREDSKSILTDSSSSVSSGPDSEISFHYKDDYTIKRPVRNHHTDEIIVDDLLHFEPVKQYTEGISVPSNASKSYAPWVLKDTERLREVKDPVSYQNQRLSNRALSTPSKAPKTYSSQIPEGSQVFDELDESGKIFNKSVLGCQVIDSAMRNNLDWRNKSKSGFSHDGFTDKVIDIPDSPVHCKDFSWNDNTVNFLKPEIENSNRRPNAARRLSFGQSSCPVFPSAADITSVSSTWTSERNPGLAGGNGGYVDTDGGIEFPDMYQRKIPEISLAQKSLEVYSHSPFQERVMSSYGETPLSKAIHSSKVPHDSPWTLEFLNRIKEKSRLRQQSLPCDTSASKLVNFGNTSKASKRRSPSILEFFKYQGGRTMKNPVDSKKQKCFVKSSSSSGNDNTSRNFLSWTPADKRARQTLLYATNGAESQTKLIWGDENAYSGNKKFRRQ